MKNKVYIITLEQILQSKVCVITDYIRGRTYSLGVGYVDELNCGFVGMFNADGELVITAALKYVNGRRILSQIDPLCDITDDDVYAWKCLIRQYSRGVNELEMLPAMAIERGFVTVREIDMYRKNTAPRWYRDTFVPWTEALLYVTRYCDFYKKKGGE